MQLERVLIEERFAFTKKATCSSSELGPTISSLFDALQSEHGGIELLAPPCLYYTRWSEADCDVEAAFVVDPSQFPGANLTRIPACEAVMTLHVGPYDTLSESWMQLWGAVQQSGIQPTSQAPWDCYLSFSDTGDPAGFETELFIPVAPST